MLNALVPDKAKLNANPVISINQRLTVFSIESPPNQMF